MINDWLTPPAKQISAGFPHGDGSKPWYPCSEHQNSWDLWMFIPLKMVCIGIDPYPHVLILFASLAGSTISGHTLRMFRMDQSDRLGRGFKHTCV